MPLDPYLGEIFPWPGLNPPDGFAFCDGQLLPIAQNQGLFSILGTIYGGDGITTFALPDLRGRTAIGVGTDGSNPDTILGEKAGVRRHALTVNEIPGHNHPLEVDIAVSPEQGNTPSPNGNIMAASGSGDPDYDDLEDQATAMHESVVELVDLGAGEDRPHENMMPYVGMHYIIALEGVFPS